jgi:CheY-like chemotaxis protein
MNVSEPERTQHEVVAVVDDLIFGSRIRAAADQLGVRVAFARSPDALQALAADARLILLDLETRWLDAAQQIARLKASPSTASVPITAFAPHVRGAALMAARAAGADRVLARSAFVKVLPELLRGE